MFCMVKHCPLRLLIRAAAATAVVGAPHPHCPAGSVTRRSAAQARIVATCAEPFWLQVCQRHIGCGSGPCELHIHRIDVCPCSSGMSGTYSEHTHNKLFENKLEASEEPCHYSRRSASSAGVGCHRSTPCHSCTPSLVRTQSRCLLTCRYTEKHHQYWTRQCAELPCRSTI